MARGNVDQGGEVRACAQERREERLADGLAEERFGTGGVALVVEEHG